MPKRSLKGSLVRFDRKPIDPHDLIGFALEWADELTLLQVVNADRMEPNGYCVIRNNDVRRWEPLGPETFMGRALRLKGIAPVFLDSLSLQSWPNLLEAAGRSFPLITLRREVMNPNVCYIGRVQSMTEKVVALKEIDPDARWEGIRRYRFRDLTKVDFGGGYEAALMLVAVEKKRRR